jgi:hypothetical protein
VDFSSYANQSLAEVRILEVLLAGSDDPGDPKSLVAEYSLELVWRDGTARRIDERVAPGHRQPVAVFRAFIRDLNRVLADQAE